MRELTVMVDGTPFASGSRFRLSGTTSIGLFPSLFTLQCWNLAEKDYLRLASAKTMSVLRGDSCLASGAVSDVFRRTVSEGTLTVAAFSLGLDLWEAPVSLSVEAGASVSETLSYLLASSGTGIQLLSFPGSDSTVSRGQVFFGRAAECITIALSAASARAYLVPAGLCVVPADPLPATLHLTEIDLTDVPMMADKGRKMILSTTVTGFQPGEEMTLAYESVRYAGLILKRMVEADTAQGPWETQLMIELH